MLNHSFHFDVHEGLFAMGVALLHVTAGTWVWLSSFHTSDSCKLGLTSR